MSIIQSFKIQIREGGIYKNGRQVFVWIDHVQHRGPFGHARCREDSECWTFFDLSGKEQLEVLTEVQAVRACAGL